MSFVWDSRAAASLFRTGFESVRSIFKIEMSARNSSSNFELSNERIENLQIRAVSQSIEAGSNLDSLAIRH